MPKPGEQTVREIKRQIDVMISDRSLGWEEVCEALEDLEEHCGEWAKQIRSEHT